MTSLTLDAASRYLNRCAPTSKGPLTLLRELGLSDDDARAIMRALFDRADRRKGQAQDRAVIETSELTTAEIEALRGAANGETVAESAEQTGRAYHTIRAQRTAAINRLGARNITHAVALAYERGLFLERAA